LTSGELKRIRNVARDIAAYLADYLEQIKEKVASLGATRPGQTI